MAPQKNSMKFRPARARAAASFSDFLVIYSDVKTFVDASPNTLYHVALIILLVDGLIQNARYQQRGL